MLAGPHIEIFGLIICIIGQILLLKPASEWEIIFKKIFINGGFPIDYNTYKLGISLTILGFILQLVGIFLNK